MCADCIGIASDVLIRIRSSAQVVQTSATACCYDCDAIRSLTDYKLPPTLQDNTYKHWYLQNLGSDGLCFRTIISA